MRLDNYSHIIDMRKEPLLRRDMGLAAKGLLATLLALPDEPNLDIMEFLATHIDDTKGVQEALAELIRYGYVLEAFSEDGHLDHIISDTPQHADVDDEVEEWA